MDFAFLGRVSTRDAQQPEQSRLWQLRLAAQLVEAHGHQIRYEFFDIGQSRSVPWSLRPQASALLAEIARPDRRFDAVVIGEPHRAFYGAQFQMTFPVLVHYGVELWVPEVGGRVDPDSEAHEVMMSLFGGMSKGERSRIRKRTRTAMYEIARHTDLHLGGRPPYGYMLIDAGPHANRSKAAAGARAHRLAPDPTTAPVVQRIFVLRAAGQSLASIARTLQSSAIPSPSAHDPERNTHRSNLSWTTSSVRAILQNPSYTGVRAWGKQEKFERLVDVTDVTLGYETAMRRRDAADWIVPATATHEGLVSRELFDRVQENTPRQSRGARRTYPLSGYLRCSMCGNLMAATFTRTNRETDPGRAYYRCETGKKDAGTRAALSHPRSVLVAQARILAALDAALAALVDDVPRLAQAIVRTSKPDYEINHTRERLRMLAAELAALEESDAGAGDSPELADQRQRLSATHERYSRHLHELQWAGPSDRDPAVLEALSHLKDLVEALQNADDTTRREIYGRIRLELAYNAEGRSALCSIEPLTLLRGPTGRQRYPGLREQFTIAVGGGRTSGTGRWPRILRYGS